MKTLTSDDLKLMESRYRARLVNSLSGVKSANLIGSIDKEGRENLSIVSSCFHLGADPALMGLIFRPAIVERHTFENILETGVYTINHVNGEIIQKAHQTSARYSKNVSEFEATHLTSVFENNFNAPFVKEANVQLGLKLKERIHLEVNKTELIIGEIVLIRLSEDILKDDGFVDLVSANSVGVTGLDCYHSINKGDRLSYAKVDLPVTKLNLDGEKL